jgi:hypothetical protein
MRTETRSHYPRLRGSFFTGKKFSAFTTTKNAFGENTVEWLMQLAKRGAHVEVLRMDPSGENKAFADRIKQVDCEITPRYSSPQFNSLAETAFPYLAACAHAMMGGANVPVECQKMIVIEALKTITLLDGLVVVELNSIQDTRDGHCFGGNPKRASDHGSWYHCRICGVLFRPHERLLPVLEPG